MRSRRLVPSLAVAGVIALSGCGGGGDTSSTSTSTSSSGQPAEPSALTQLGVHLGSAPSGKSGVLVVSVDPNSASRLHEGDLITEADGKPVASVDELDALVGNPEPGDQFTLQVTRGSKEFPVTEVLSPTAFLGTQVKDAKPGPGALVTATAPGSPALKAGFETGDVIVSIDGKPVVGGKELLAEIATHSPGDEVELGITRDGKDMTLTAVLAERPTSGNP